MKKEKFKVILSAGGESSRFRNIAGAGGIQKSVFRLPNGDTMMERTIKMYRDAGITDFVILLYHNADSVIDLLGDGSSYGVNIKYSFDPGKPVGRGGAIKNALLHGLISEDEYIIVHNPDDQIVGDNVSLIKEIIGSHIDNEKKGIIATAVMVPGVRYDYTGFTIEEGIVLNVEMYPLVNIPAHIGLTIFSPSVYKHFEELFDFNNVSDFESVLFPVLVNERLLASFLIDSHRWIPVNDEKGLKKIIKALAN